MENLNAEQIKKELALFIDDMPHQLHLRERKTAEFRVFLENVLTLIKELTQAHEMLSESYDHLEKTKDELLAERARLTEENERLEKLCALRDQDNKDTQDLLYKAEAKNTELEKKYALAVAEREADVKGFSKMLAVIHDYTVQKMQDRFNKVFGGMDATQVLLRRTFDQIAREEMENEKETKGR